jgi:hypothetical protein
MRWTGWGILVLAAASPAQAQPAGPVLPNLPAESVTVTATRPSEAAINDFIATRAAPARLTGKLSRWRTGICPQVWASPSNMRLMWSTVCAI